MSKKPVLKPCEATINLHSVPGIITVDGMLDTAVAVGLLRGGAPGVWIDLRKLRAAIDVAISRIYPNTSKTAPCGATLQVATQSEEAVPMLIISGDYDTGQVRQCVVIAGMIHYEEQSRIDDVIKKRENNEVSS